MLATRAVEADLESKIDRLRAEYVAAQEALDRLRAMQNKRRREDEEEVDNSHEPQRPISLPSHPSANLRAMDAASRMISSSIGIQSVSSSNYSLATVPRPPSKKGYLFRWMDREIGWSGTKWALRFVNLESGHISYYGSHTESYPRYMLTLSGCAVRDEGWKRNRRHTSWKRRGLWPFFSSGSSALPPLEEQGAYFFVFSIYYRSKNRKGVKKNDDEDDTLSSQGMNGDESGPEISPLLRFSTPSLAEKNQWVQLLAEQCAWCETDDFVIEENNRATELLGQQQQQAQMAQAMPEAKDGTLPPLIFALPPPLPPKRQPSFHRRAPSSQANMYKSHTKPSDVDKLETQKKAYPPSKPMHRIAAPSYLSFDAPPQNYRGLFNLSMIILIVSSFRLLLAAIQQHGFILLRIVQHLQDVREIRRNPWHEVPVICGFVLQLLFVTLGVIIEWLLGHQLLYPKIGKCLHHINAHSALVIPMSIVWQWIDNPVTGVILIFHATITWMKLLSYAHANEDYRLGASSEVGLESFKASLAQVENLDPSEANIVYPQNLTLTNMFYFWFAPTLTYQIVFPKYPRVRFWVVSGLLVRMVVVLSLVTFLVAQLVSPTLESLVNDLKATNGAITASILTEYWLKLCITNTYLWLLMSYFYFHLYLNLFAELLRFGDRVFYKDWWNSSNVSAYWRLWNTPVHYWLIRHVYFPCLRRRISRGFATFAVFLLSAVMHEVVVSVPFHMIRPWTFLGMMGQIPLIGLTKFLERRHPGSSMGNLIFWISFCLVGQPMAILLYTIDYQYSLQLQQQQQNLSQEELLAAGLVKMNAVTHSDETCRILWRNQTCLVR